MKKITSIIIVLAILIACATAHTAWAETTTTAETTPVTNGFSIMPFIFTMDEIDSYNSYIADWKEWIND